MNNIKNEIEKYWDYLDNLSELVKPIAARQWDYTGRPLRQFHESITELLDASGSCQHFVVLYKELVGDMKTINTRESEAEMYYRIYMHAQIKAIREYSAEINEKIFNK